ncbi:hypothetical protein O6H91_14G082700 [Diphasiastrum complanatum]|nr:hypothetical protein O6H91_14G082700 [Diphasiastrum complanatum]KAJ7532319.1 hypothetical protein O6H91_14G082700 [Diphasiastrum complanatum]
MEAGKSGAHSSSLGEMDFGKKLEVSLSGLDHFSPRLLASSLERCCGSMAIQSAWIQRLTPANRNSESKSSSKAWNMSNDRCVKLNQNLSLASDVQSDGYISSKKADKGSVERKCIAQLFERSRSPSLSFKKPKLYKEQIIVFDEGSERLASKPNALQLLSSDSKDVSGKNPQIEISKQLMENLKDLNEASINSPTQGSVAQPILSSKAGSRHRDPENSATHMELTRIPYEQNVVGFGPFRAGSRKPPLPQSDNSRIICSKAFDPPESHAFQYKVVKLGAWSKRKYSILSEASKPWPVLTEDRLGKLAQHHTVADIHYDNHEIQDAVQDLKMKRSTCNSVSKESGASVLGCSSASDNTKGPTAAYIPSRGVFFHLDFWNGDQAQIKSDLDQNRDREPWRLSAPSPQEKEEKALNIYNRGEPDAIAQSSLPENPILSCESGKAVIQSSTPGTTRACTPTLASFKHVINYEREPLASALALNADGNACKRSLLKRDADKDQWLDIAQTWFKRWCSPVANSIASSGNPVENRQNDSVNPPLNLQEVKSAHSRVKILGKYTKWRKCEEGLSTAKPFTKDSFVYHGFNLVSHSTSHPTLYFTPSVSALALASRMVKQVYTSSKARKFV